MKNILLPCFPRPSEGKQTPKVLQGLLLVTFQLLNAFQKSQAQFNYRAFVWPVPWCLHDSHPCLL